MELALIENLQREDLTPLEEAQGYQSLIDQYGMTQEEIARTVGNPGRLLQMPCAFCIFQRTFKSWSPRESFRQVMRGRFSGSKR